MSNQKPISLGLVGVGRAGWGMHTSELRDRMDRFSFVAACDVISSRRQQMADRYGCRTYEHVEDLIADPDVEVVDIATRSCDHFTHTMLALEAGKTVFLEKPITLTETEARKLQATAAKTGQLYIRHNRRFEPAFQHIQEIIASGVLGDVYEVKLRRDGYGRRDDWQTIQRFGGGQLLNWGPHIIDHALRFLNSPIESQWSDLKQIAAAGDSEDHLKIVLRGRNGRVVDLEISGGAALAEPVYHIFGTKGALTSDEKTITLRYLDPDVALPARIARPETPESGFGTPETLPWVQRTIDVAPAAPVSMESLWDNLYETIRNGAPYPISLDEAVQVMHVISTAKQGTRFE